MQKRLIALVCLMLLPAHAHAVTGGKPARDRDGLRRSVIRIENSVGELCTGTLLARDVALTAAHCLTVPARYRAVILDSRFRPTAIDIVAIERYGSFANDKSPQQQTGVDLALVKLERAVPAEMEPLTITGEARIRVGADLYLAGYGSTSYDNDKSARTLRIAHLAATALRQPPNDVVFATDPRYGGRLPGAGACRGDSGGPVFISTSHGYEIGGVVSWSARASFAKDNSPCGGTTVITPLAPYLGWIAAGLERLSGGH